MSLAALARQHGLNPDFVRKLVAGGMSPEDAVKQRPKSAASRARMSKALGHWTRGTPFKSKATRSIVA